jgi:hypothetical protein
MGDLEFPPGHTPKATTDTLTMIQIPIGLRVRM